MGRPRTLRGRLALYYALALAALLIIYTGVVFTLAIADDVESGQESEREEARSATKRLLIAVAVGLPVTLSGAAAGGMWLARRALQPIDDVVRVARELRTEDLDRRIPNPGGAGEEVERLVGALNGMLERLQRSVQGMRRFTADASHELRTPIAVMMGDLEVALRRPRDAEELRGTLEATLEELGHLAGLIDLLLTLARADARELPIQKVSTEADDVARQVIEAYEDIAEHRSLRLSCSYAGGAPVRADPLWLGRALINLVDNACKFTPPGGEVRVAVERDGDRVRIAVSDTGPGLTPEESERAFDRFYRGASARGSSEGFGLGLPLARDIARALGGDLRADRPEPGGARFLIDLPAAA